MVSEGFEHTVEWFRDQQIAWQQEHIERLESSLFLYRAGFWGLVIVLAVFIAGALMEVWP